MADRKRRRVLTHDLHLVVFRVFSFSRFSHLRVKPTTLIPDRKSHQLAKTAPPSRQVISFPLAVLDITHNHPGRTFTYTLENVKTGLLVNVPHNSKQENLAFIPWGNQRGADNEIWGIRGEGSVVQFLSKNQMAISIANPAPNSEIIQVNPQATPELLWMTQRLKDR